MADAMLYVVGLGPGDARYLTAQAQTALQAADVLCGYTVYIDLVRPLYPDKRSVYHRHDEGNRPRRWALETAQSGKTVALVSPAMRRVRHGQPAAGTGTGLPSVTVETCPPDGGLGGGAVLGSIGARFLCDLSFGSAHALDRHPKNGWPARRWGTSVAHNPSPRGQADYLQKPCGSYCKTAARRRSAASCATLAARGGLLAC